MASNQVSAALPSDKGRTRSLLQQEENAVIDTLTGFSLTSVLTGLDLPSGPGLSNQLGISGLPSLSEKQIFNDKWDDADAVGPGEGEDWEDEVDRELEEEDEQTGTQVKMEVQSPLQIGQKEKKKRIIRRLVERPKTVYERFPTFEKDKVLNFTELFKGHTVGKSRIAKRPFHSAYILCWLKPHYSLDSRHSRTCIPSKEGRPKRIPGCYCRRY